MIHDLRNSLIDSFGRRHTNLRISVTDRCNIRCFYCMPQENVRFKPRDELLSFEEIERVARVASQLGVNKLRITGGEPLIRAELSTLIRKLVSLDRITEVALTTNGILLPDQAQRLKEAGLHRVNISLDTLDEATFQRIARRDGLQRVLSGIAAARKAGFVKIRLNAVPIRSVNEADIVPMAQFARQHELELRFIEFMPLDAEDNWSQESVLAGAEIREKIEAEICQLRPVVRTDASQPAVDYEFVDGIGRIGFINPVSQPFCGDCNRLRLTAEGQVRNCLFSIQEWDARGLLRGQGTDRELAELLQDCVRAKKPGHGIDSPQFVKPERAMYQIGG